VRRPQVRPAWRWLAVVLWMAVIFYVSAQPDLPHHPQATGDVVLKKTAHVVEYGILASLLYWAWGGDVRTHKKRAILGAWVVAALYAVSDELHQGFVPGRDSQALDVAFDLVGATLALLVVRRLFPRGETPPGR